MKKKIIIAAAITAIIAGSAVVYAKGSTVSENTYQPAPAVSVAPITTQAPSDAQLDKGPKLDLSGRQSSKKTEQPIDKIEQKFYSTPDIPSPEEVIAATPKGIDPFGKFLTPDPTKPGKYIEVK